MPSSMATRPEGDMVPSALDPTIGGFLDSADRGVISVTQGTNQDLQRLHFTRRLQLDAVSSLGVRLPEIA